MATKEAANETSNKATKRKAGTTKFTDKDPQQSTPAAKAKGPNPGSKSAKKPKARHGEFTNQEKLNKLDEIDRKTASQQDICANYGASQRTISSW